AWWRRRMAMAAIDNGLLPTGLTKDSVRSSLPRRCPLHSPITKQSSIINEAASVGRWPSPCHQRAAELHLHRDRCGIRPSWLCSPPAPRAVVATQITMLQRRRCRAWQIPPHHGRVAAVEGVDGSAGLCDHRLVDRPDADGADGCGGRCRRDVLVGATEVLAGLSSSSSSTTSWSGEASHRRSPGLMAIS
ncbi:hypothetical protein EE612_013784, partial [Oryza sativa]